MQYQISRNGQMYGPYTLEDLQRYLASGNVLPTDLVKSEEMTEWVPVSQLISAAANPAPQPTPPEPASAQAQAPYSVPSDPTAGYAGLDYGSGGAHGASSSNAILAASPYPDAPNLHWGLVLLFSVLTCGLFMFIWNLVVASWLKRVQPNATSIFFYAGAAALYFVHIVAGVGSMPHHYWAHGDHMNFGNPWLGLLWFVRWVTRLIARFSQRASLEEHFNGPEPVGLRLDAVMTFFFGGLYFQSKLNDINALKQAARFGVGRQF